MLSRVIIPPHCPELVFWAGMGTLAPVSKFQECWDTLRHTMRSLRLSPAGSGAGFCVSLL